MNVLDGKAIASELLAGLRQKPVPKKFMAGILIGADPASESFQKLKEKTGKELGVDYRIYRLPETDSNDALRKEVGRIAAQRTCGGVLVQLPLPGHLNRQYILNAIPKEKDVDVLGERAMGAFYAGRGKVVPPAAGTVEEILKRTQFDLMGKTAAVVGPGFLIGRPVALWLMGGVNPVRNSPPQNPRGARLRAGAISNGVKELIIMDRGSDYALLKHADLVILSVGRAGLVKPAMLKNGAGVIDFSYSVAQVPPQMSADVTPYNSKLYTGQAQINADKKLVGDFDVSSLTPNTQNLTPSFYTPTPGGTGPILVAKLFENFYMLTE